MCQSISHVKPMNTLSKLSNDMDSSLKHSKCYLSFLSFHDETQYSVQFLGLTLKIFLSGRKNNLSPMQAHGLQLPHWDHFHFQNLQWHHDFSDAGTYIYQHYIDHIRKFAEGKPYLMSVLSRML